MYVSQIAQPTALNRNSDNRYLHVIREHIAEFYETQSPFSGEIEINKSFFGASGLKEKEAGAPRQNYRPQYLKRNGKVYTKIVPHLLQSHRASGHPGQGHSRYGWRGGLENIFRIDHKQYELKFNYQDQDLYKLLINIIRKKPLF